MTALIGVALFLAEKKEDAVGETFFFKVIGAALLAALVMGIAFYHVGFLRRMFAAVIAPVFDCTIGLVFGVSLGRLIIRKNLKSLIRQKKYDQAVEYARKHEAVRDAAAVFERRREFAEGARFARRAGDERLARALFERAFSKTVHSDRRQALEIAEEGGLYHEAADLTARIRGPGFREKSARYALKAGQHDYAIRVFLQTGRTHEAVQAALDAGDPSRAIEICMKSADKNFHIRSAKIATEHGMFKTALEIYERYEYYKQAARTAEKAGLYNESKRFAALARKKKQL